MKRDHSAARRFATALAVTLLIAAGITGILLSLRRMEETMNGGSYTLFSLREQPAGQLEVTALEHGCRIDLSGLRRAGEQWERLAPAAPAEWNLFGTAVSGLVEWLSGLIARFL